MSADVNAVSSSTSSVTILAANNRRKGAAITNDSTAILYIRFGDGAASSTDFSVEMAADAYFEVPKEYRGTITGAWATANGNARVTEWM